MAMGIEGILKFGYSLIIVTFLLMLWASLSGAKEFNSNTVGNPPCSFNPLCTCSQSAPDLGVVQCRNVPFPAIPDTVNDSKVFTLHMENTGLREIEAYFLQSTGLYKIHISNNPITDIPEHAFSGLERSLWELILHNNQLIEIPTRAIRQLKKLKQLDLSGNDITLIESDTWRGLESSLQILNLAENSISSLPPDSFSSLPLLDTLDLSGNNLAEIESDVFRDGMGRLTKVYLSDNILSDIPYLQISPLKMLRILDLSNNRIATIFPHDDPDLPISIKLSLDTLHLEYNQIEVITTESFRHLDAVNQTFLDGNPIRIIEEHAFVSARIQELYIRHCKLDAISPLAFEGLENSLHILDLSGNNITSLPEKLLSTFDYLRVFNLKDNKMKTLVPNEMFNGFHYTLFKLDLSGDNNGQTNLQDIRRMRNLRSLYISKMTSDSLSANDFVEFGVELEDLKVVRGRLKSIQSNAFKHVRGIKRLDLSENHIETIDKDAFEEIGHSLTLLRISHGLTAKMSSLPSDSLRHLTSLQELDFSNNKIKSLSDTSFHFLKNLRLLELQDNQIDQVLKGTFQGDIHSKLEKISISFNNLKQISQHTFVDLAALHTLELDDNRIERLERRAFMNLDHLKIMELRGNKIDSISDEAFQNLPRLEHIDIAYNSLTTFDFDYFDQVGTLSSLRVNISHNKINELRDNATSLNRDHGYPHHSNINILDLSYNNISRINAGFFKPVDISLSHLYLSNNLITNTSREVFGNMLHLQWLDLSDNLINDLNSDSFRNTKKLQVLLLSNNEISEISFDTFRNNHNLRIVKLSENHLRSLPDNLFMSSGIEHLDLSQNQLTKIPVTTLSNIAALTLCELDLSHNNIGAIHSMDLSNKFRSLSWLDLSYNRLVRLEDAIFATLPKLAILDLSHNNELEVVGKAFIGMENSLIELGLENISISSVPELPLLSLRNLRISHNELPTVPPELALNMTSLRKLDLSYNDLTNVPLITHSLPQLKSLILAGNPITSLTNTSLLGAADSLEELDIAQFHLNTLEYGALSKLHSLRSLRISAYPSLPHFNIPRLLENAESLRELWIEAPIPLPVGQSDASHSSSAPAVAASTDLRREMEGILPHKLRNVMISGKEFTTLSDNIFKGIRSVAVHLGFFNTSLTGLPKNIFQDIGYARNISLVFESNNEKLQRIPNSNSAHYPHMPESVFLTSLKISGNSLSCDCDLGWIEFWQRKKRQHICATMSTNPAAAPDVKYATNLIYNNLNDCEDAEDDLREVTCSNKNNEKLIEVLKSELECGWGSTASNHRIVISLIVVSVFTALLF